MAITLHDFIKPYMDQLQQVENLTQQAVKSAQDADKTFTGHRDDLIDYELAFSGLGATAFSNSVDQNVLRSKHIVTKLDNVREASNHIRRMIDSTTSDHDTSLNIPTAYVDWSSDALDHYGMVLMEVQHRLRDDTLIGDFHGELDAVLRVNDDVLTTWVNGVRDTIKSEFQNKHDSRINEINDRYAGIKRRRGGDHEDPTLKADQNQELQYENIKLQEAQFEVDRIAKYVLDTMESWRSQIQVLTAEYLRLVLGAANIEAVSAGEIIQQLLQGDAPIMIWKTASGGLIVGVKGFNNGLSDAENAKIVEDAIKKYIEENGLPGTTHVTMLGYQDGGKITQQVAQDVAGNSSGFPYQINNEVLVGSELVGTPAYNTEYDAYSFTRDMSISGGWGPIFAPDYPSLATNLILGVNETVPLFLAASYIEGVGEHIYDRQSNDAQSQLQGMDPSHTYSVDQRAPDHIQLLPDEIDAHNGSIFSDPHYDQSSALNNVLIPDPVQTSNRLPADNTKRVPITSPSDNPISAPTSFYVHKGDQLPSSSSNVPGANDVVYTP